MPRDNKELFKIFTERKREKLPFSLHYEWWAEVVEENWDVAVNANQEQVSAVWPYFIRQKGPWRILCQPPYTPYSGPFLIYPGKQKPDSRIKFEITQYRQLIEQLPDFAELEQTFPLQFQNSLAFMWEGFSDQKRYTYLIDLTSEEGELYDKLRENTRRQIKKAKKHLEIRYGADPDTLYNFLKNNQGEGTAAFPLNDHEYLKRMLDYIGKYDCGQVTSAVDEKGQLHAMLLTINDHSMAYYLMGSTDKKLKDFGGMSLLLWESITHAKMKGLKDYNLEGSSIPAIEKFLRGFGGRLIPYTLMKKHNSSIMQIFQTLRLRS
jgi:hypothetical protein